LIDKSLPVAAKSEDKAKAERLWKKIEDSQVRAYIILQYSCKQQRVLFDL